MPGWSSSRRLAQEPSPFRFAEVAQASGIDFRHFSGMTEAKHFPTANGSGVAFLDYDGDGKLDVYFATATLLPLGTARKGPNRLYKNLGDGKFRDVTESSGPGLRGLLPRDRRRRRRQRRRPRRLPLQLRPQRPVPQQRRRDLRATSATPPGSTGRAGRPAGPSSTCDDDGDLDLYVANYGIWKLPEDDVFCGDKEKHIRFYCSPRTIRTTKHFLYRNNGDGTFTDVYDQFLVDAEGKKIPGRTDGHGFAAVAADLDGDGKVDLYVANDMNPNFLYPQQGQRASSRTPPRPRAPPTTTRARPSRAWGSTPRTSTATATST